MFREMRRKDREIFDEELLSVLNNGEYGTLATIGDNGYPYAVPVSYVYFENAVYFHCAAQGTKLDNIKNNNKVSFSIVGKTKVLPDKFSTEYESIVVFGHAVQMEGEEKRKALFALIEKYSSEFKEEGRAYIERASNNSTVVKINIDKMTGKARR
jgi:nitroimidazol reductase NimA-like FMN-containing flavoprotein (pyridoxamine 5'-phosphate oxidase superfamily)